MKVVTVPRRSINQRDRWAQAKPWKRSALRFRRFACGLLCLIVVAACVSQRGIVAAEPVLARVDSIRVTVNDADASAAFYSAVLSFHKISDVEIAGSDVERLEGVFGSRVRNVRMRLGSEYLDLMQFLAPRGRPVPADFRSNDRWFQHIAIVVSDMDRAYQKLRAAKVQFISSAPQRLPAWNKRAAGIEAFYFKDPDNHALEIIHFPSDKGDPKWHNSSDRLFIGIDHTAIVVSDTERSIRFYRDLLGLRVVGESENYGTEQEHLANVFGAHLRITSLRGRSAPGVELLEYLTPGDGRPFPVDERANDLINWQICMLTLSPDAARYLRAARIDFVSPNELSIPSLGLTQAVTLRDPDGHQIELIRR
jgi:catechol 2,3-dioxygenase-like lactoylglutathione lyase family enzyme